MTDPTFRVATADDAQAVVSLVESAYRGDSSRSGWTTEADLLDGQRTDFDAVLATISADDRLVLLALEGEQLLGCCELRRLPDNAGYFGMFAVVPTLQGGGVGKLILAEAERRVGELWGAERMEMTVLAQREDLVSWYVRRGYRRTGLTEPFPYGDERFGLPRRDDLVFEKLTKTL
jgi:ribosomal protein S18 acetylase RimI-like enzyme